MLKAIHCQILYLLDKLIVMNILECYPIILHMVYEMALAWPLTPLQDIYGIQKMGPTTVMRSTLYCRDLTAVGRLYKDLLQHRRMRGLTLKKTWETLEEKGCTETPNLYGKT